MSDGRPGATTPRDRATLFHLATRDEWAAAASSDVYAPGAYAHESFIHCSYREQLDGVYERYYAGRDDLRLLEIDRDVLEQLVGASHVRDEVSTGGEAFPHVYAPLPRAAVRAVHDVGWFRPR